MPSDSQTLKNIQKKLVREAILRGAAEGRDPVEFMLPYVDELTKMAKQEDLTSPTKMAAIKEIFDRVDGKAKQEIATEDSGERVVNKALLGFAKDLLAKIPGPVRPGGHKRERVVEATVIEPEAPEAKPDALPPELP